MTIEARRNSAANNNSVVLDSYSDIGRVEIVKDRLYFAVIDGSPVNDNDHFYFRTDEEFHYESFYEDFGPLNLAMLYRYCVRLQRRLKMLNLSKKRLVHFVPSDDHHQRVNAAYLIGSFAIIVLNKTAEETWRLFEKMEPFLPFRDAALGPSTYDLQLRDVFAGVEKAVKHKWLNFNDDAFNVDEYEFFEKVENGDFNWIIPGKILAFCGPHNKAGIENGYPHHSPETYFSYFRKHNVTTIVRLNRKLYDARRFTNSGFHHADLFFTDGSCPNDQIVLSFIRLVEQAPGALAVHCKAGLGRTGTLIACWMMMKFGLTAAECIAWIRICRPGSVIGPQQEFLIEKQDWCWQMQSSTSPLSKTNVSTTSSSATNVPAVAAAAVNGLVTQVDEIKISNNNGPPCEVTDTNTPITVIASNGSTHEDPQPMDVAASENGKHSQGEQLMRIKGTRGSGRNLSVQSPTRSGGSCTKVASESSIGMPKRVLSGRVRRASSIKEQTRNIRKLSVPHSTSGTAAPMASSGPARKAAKHQVNADASSSYNISNASPNHSESQRAARSLLIRRQQHQRFGRSSTTNSAASASTVIGGGTTSSSYSKSGRTRRSTPYKSSMIPLAVSGTNRFDGSTSGTKPSKPVPGSSKVVRPMHHSSSAFVHSALSSSSNNPEKKDNCKKTSPYFLRRRSVSNMQTMLLPKAPTTVNSSNMAALISPLKGNYAAINTSLPQPITTASVPVPRRTSNIFNKSKR